MKKMFLLTVLLIALSVSMVFAVTPVITGVGNPVSLTASEAGLIYVNTSSGQKWVSNSTTKGDWSKVSVTAESGSVATPFTVLYLTPSAVPTTDLATGAIYLDSTTLKLMTCVEYTTGETTATWTASW